MASSNTRHSSDCKSLSTLICHYPGIIVGVVLTLFLLAILQLYNPFTAELKIKIDPSEQALLGEHHEGWEFYEFSRRNFGGDETIMIAVEADDVFSPQAVNLVSRLTDRLSKVQGVREVISLSNALTIRSTAYGMDIAPVMEKLPETPEEYETLRSDVMSNPLIASALISADSDTTAIVVNLEDIQGQEFFARVNSEVDTIVDEEA
ncbi:MAG: hypothetical protein KAT90_13295, partial [Gammaproteobacteria bacterium]|nr:hypothetical protein [Gammaproteobacteria bacterium]